jgi:hypothetical protein
LAAYALRRNLLDWLETFKVEKLCAARLQVRPSQVTSTSSFLLQPPLADVRW